LRANYPALTDGASRFIGTLTPGILAKYSTIAEAFSSPAVYSVPPTLPRPLQGESPTLLIVTEAPAAVQTAYKDLS